MSYMKATEVIGIIVRQNIEANDEYFLKYAINSHNNINKIPNL